jgi:uncharacterized protein YdeI (BOF family)
MSVSSGDNRFVEVTTHMLKYVVILLTTLLVSGIAWPQAPFDSEIREIRTIRRGEVVVVRGEIIRFQDYDELRIQDATGRIDIYLGEHSIAQPPFQVGDTIMVMGRVDDDLFDIPREIYATQIGLQDGSTLTVGSPEGWD